MTKKNLVAISVAALGVVVCLAWAPAANAGDFDHRTVFTVNQPIRIPGNVVLAPGTYVIKLADSASLNLVRIMDKTETKVYGTFFGIPEPLLKYVDKPMLHFDEHADGAVPPLRSWAYPGQDVALFF